VEKLALTKHQKMAWLIDCWSVHKSGKLLGWMKQQHPCVHVIFVPTNFTNTLQHVDVIFQRSFKHAFKKK